MSLLVPPSNDERRHVGCIYLRLRFWLLVLVLVRWLGLSGVWDDRRSSKLLRSADRVATAVPTDAPLEARSIHPNSRVWEAAPAPERCEHPDEAEMAAARCDVEWRGALQAWPDACLRRGRRECCADLSVAVHRGAEQRGLSVQGGGRGVGTQLFQEAGRWRMFARRQAPWLSVGVPA